MKLIYMYMHGCVEALFAFILTFGPYHGKTVLEHLLIGGKQVIEEEMWHLIIKASISHFVQIKVKRNIMPY